ncbi:hypothetical protein BGX34_000641 [Mortierella sp. NVP85]|nr:hypothetical protein BGX34_000641 [Mortierella sp. NVP85]
MASNDLIHSCHPTNQKDLLSLAGPQDIVNKGPGHEGPIGHGNGTHPPYGPPHGHPRVKPSKREELGKQGKPSKDEKPEEPGKGKKPEKPGKGKKPEKPEKPDKSMKPGKPVPTPK